MRSRTLSPSNPHFHIRWSEKSALDWEAFATRDEAEKVAERLAHPAEPYIIEEFTGTCKRCAVLRGDERHFRQENALTKKRVSILLVDNSRPFTLAVSSLLRTNHRLRIVSEASDGIEAIEKTKKFQPDIILLDISLPRLNGIEAARHIHNVAPHSKIIFLTQERDPEIIAEGMRSGAAGYVLKSNAASELLTTIERMLCAEESIGTGMGVDDRPDAREHRTRSPVGCAPYLGLSSNPNQTPRVASERILPIESLGLTKSKPRRPRVGKRRTCHQPSLVRPR